jgi:aspartyl-tRNA synthetase
VVRAIPAPGAAANPRSFFDKMNEWAREQGAGGLGYITFEAEAPRGPIARNLEADRAEAIREACGLKPGDAVFFAAGKAADAAKLAGTGAPQLGTDLGLTRRGRLPLLLGSPTSLLRAERGNRPGRLQPQPLQHAAGRAGGAEHHGPADIKAYQYDIVCNGIELASRRHPQPQARRS